MHVKLEPNDHLELPVDLITDIESDLFREQLFGNHCVSNSVALKPTPEYLKQSTSSKDISESSSDDDHLSKFSLPCEPFADAFGNHPLWGEPRTSRSSSSSGSFDQALIEMETRPNPFIDFNNDDLDFESVTCSPRDIIMSPAEMKEESSLGSRAEGDSSATVLPLSDSDSFWDLLCSSDIKPNITTMETPPITPPDSCSSNSGDSPPTSPYQAFSSDVPKSPSQLIQLHTPKSLPSTAVITVNSVNSAHGEPRTPPRKRIALAPKIPFKIVTTITAKENTSIIGKCRTINIQPKSTSVCKGIIAVASAVPKFTDAQTASARTFLKTSGKQLLQKPVIISTAPSTVPASHSSPVSSINPVISGTTVPAVVRDQKTSRFPPLAPALNPTFKSNPLAELRALKRQQRMIKNRESASLSRKRKKEYLQGLEDKVQELEAENTKLKAENDRLLRRVTLLENEKVIMRAARFPIKRSSTALLGCAFLFFFNFSPLLNVFQGNVNSFPGESWKVGAPFKPGMSSLENNAQFHSRSLLSLASLEDISGSQMEDIPEQRNFSHICPLNFNSTESIRIENDLRDWFDLSLKDWPSGRKVKGKFNPVINPKSNIGRRKSILEEEKREYDEARALAAPLTSIVSTAAYQYLYRSESEPLDPLPKGHNWGSFHGIMSRRESIHSLLESIERRNDTYYVVSLTADHLLFPASAHNASARPKMSLLFPTPKALNDHNDHVGIMQIDCEVTHTQVVRWSQSPDMNVPSAPGPGVFSDAPVNSSETKESLRRDKSSLKRKKKKRV